MFCQKCGKENKEGSKFCVGCGASLNPTTEKKEVVKETTSNKDEMVNKAKDVLKGIPFKEYFKKMLDLVLKPVNAIKEMDMFEDIKHSAIVTGIVTLCATLITLMTTIFSLVRVRHTDYLTSKVTTEWVWDNIKGIGMFGYTIKVLLVFIVIIALIAGLIYVAAKIMKKEVKFNKMLGLSALSLVPALLCLLVVGPILSLIYIPLGVIVMVAGLVYSFTILFTGINNEIVLKGDKKIFFNASLITLTLLASTYIYVRFIYVSTLALSLSSYAGLFDLDDVFSLMY